MPKCRSFSGVRRRRTRHLHNTSRNNHPRLERGAGGVEGRESVVSGAAATMGLSSLSMEFPWGVKRGNGLDEEHKLIHTPIPQASRAHRLLMNRFRKHFKATMCKCWFTPVKKRLRIPASNQREISLAESSTTTFTLTCHRMPGPLVGTVPSFSKKYHGLTENETRQSHMFSMQESPSAPTKGHQKSPIFQSQTTDSNQPCCLQPRSMSRMSVVIACLELENSWLRLPWLGRKVFPAEKMANGRVPFPGHVRVHFRNAVYNSNRQPAHCVTRQGGRRRRGISWDHFTLTRTMYPGSPVDQGACTPL